MELSTNDRFMVLGVSLIMWFLLIFNIAVPNEGFIQVIVPRSVLIAEMVVLLVIGLFLAVTSVYLSMVEIRKHYRLNNQISLTSD